MLSGQATQRFAEAAALAEECSETTVAEVLLGEEALCLSNLGYGPLAALAFAGLFTERFAEADRAQVIALATAEQIGAALATPGI